MNQVEAPVYPALGTSAAQLPQLIEIRKLT